MRSMPFILAALATSVFACAPATPAVQPTELSAPQHEAAAAQEEQKASEQAAKATPAPLGCQDAANKRGCWTILFNPTDAYKKEAERHRKMAAEHRAASQALRDAEARSCGDVSDDDRDMSPFAHVEDLVKAEELKSDPKVRPFVARTAGATITFRAVQGMTEQWLQRVVDCHLSRNAADGYPMKECAYCPLALKNVTAKVTASGGGFDVAVKSDDDTTAREILKRAKALVASTK